MLCKPAKHPSFSLKKNGKGPWKSLRRLWIFFCINMPHISSALLVTVLLCVKFKNENAEISIVETFVMIFLPILPAYYWQVYVVDCRRVCRQSDWGIFSRTKSWTRTAWRVIQLQVWTSVTASVAVAATGTGVRKRAGVNGVTPLPSGVRWWILKCWGQATGCGQCFVFLLMLWHWWLGDRKDIWPVKDLWDLSRKLVS